MKKKVEKYFFAFLLEIFEICCLIWKLLKAFDKKFTGFYLWLAPKGKRKKEIPKYVSESTWGWGPTCPPLCRQRLGEADSPTQLPSHPPRGCSICIQPSNRLDINWALSRYDLITTKSAWCQGGYGGGRRPLPTHQKKKEGMPAPDFGPKQSITLQWRAKAEAFPSRNSVNY